MSSVPIHRSQLIIGAGLAGLSAAYYCPSAHILETSDHVGGKARSEYFKGFTFDVTGHWLHLRDPDMRALVLSLCGEDHFVEVERISRIWSHGVYTLYPFQANTFGLPPEVIKECVMGAIEARAHCPHELSLDEEPERFDDWVKLYFGEGIAKHFMIPYNAKLWGVKASDITSRWCQRFVPRPRLEDIVAGAVGCHQQGMGYNAVFLYPKQGGIQSVAEALADGVGRARISLKSSVQSIRPSHKMLTLAHGVQVSYERLLSTMHLTHLIDLCGEEVPSEIRQARTQLRATDVTYFNVGIQGKLGQPDHWVYVPEEKWPMYRVGSFSNARSTMAPEGHSSLYIELSDRDTAPDLLLPRVIEGLIEMGMIERAEQVIFAHPHRIPQAYVIYDDAYAEARSLIHDWLKTQDILSTGRYGDWNYSSMEDALLNGREGAGWLRS